ncbi:sugar phosphate isomerase/epimerase family protein [Roseivirga sp.]|uniref:sugar phosphate isomerase/epimerase family protein n=1 Tax=Roseivirga sp. TaxID=1964215 RepID=UPI003B529BEB
MKQKRRSFLKTAGGFAAGLALAPYACTSGIKTEEAVDTSAFGLQLYTLRDDFPKDPKGVLAQVASFGYKQIESYEGPQGMFWGMTNKEFKAYMDELGMNIVASHCDIDNDFERKAAEAAEIGMKYLICPWRSQQTLDGYRQAAADFNAKGEICRANGIRFAYHNHAYSFTEMEGEMPQDIFMNETDPDLVDFEMDMYWVVTGGQDPKAWFNKYPGRFKLGHVKDRLGNTEEAEATCTLGTGIIDYPSIVPEAKTAGMEYFIVEQERYDGTTPLKSTEANAAYMADLLG